MSITTPQICIDNRWISCSSAEGYGTLGIRYVCDLGTSAGQPEKRLLIRHRVWPQTAGDGQGALAKLTTGTVARNGQLGLRPVVVGKYHQNTPRKDGSPLIEIRDIMQQDVTGLIPLKQAILRAVQSSQPQQIWQVFYNACKALDDFGKTVGAERPVPLQSPESLVVDANNRCVPLDAEILVAGSPVDGEASRLYRNWFGESGSKGFADPQTASVMHANALLLYFRQVLDSWQRQAGEGGRPLPAIVATPLQRMPAGVSLEDCESWIRDSAENWDIFIDDEESPAAIPNTSSEFAPSRTSPRKNRSLLLRLSLYLNLLLIGALAVLWLLWPHRSGAVSPSEPARDDALGFSSYAVVFPTQGTISEKVDAALKESFPDQLSEIKGHAPDPDKLLQKTMQESIDSIREVDKLKRLLTRLGDDHSIRFKGFTTNNPNEGLKAVIARGGIYTMAGLSREEHGSLLQTNGLEKILDRAGLKDDHEAQELLDSLKKAITEYASLKDALSIIGDAHGLPAACEADGGRSRPDAEKAPQPTRQARFHFPSDSGVLRCGRSDRRQWRRRGQVFSPPRSPVLLATGRKGRPPQRRFRQQCQQRPHEVAKLRGRRVHHLEAHPPDAKQWQNGCGRQF